MSSQLYYIFLKEHDPSIMIRMTPDEVLQYLEPHEQDKNLFLIKKDTKGGKSKFDGFNHSGSSWTYGHNYMKISGVFKIRME